MTFTKKHGMRDTRFYRIYQAMKSRCTNSRHIHYRYYGGRGITVEWPVFEDFLKDMHASYLRHVREFGEKNTTIDRIDGDGPYSKKNCRWATMQVQNLNHSSRVFIEYAGKNKPIAEWAEEAGIELRLLRQRIRYGWDMRRALETPVRRRK